MAKISKKFGKAIANIAYESAKKSANCVCIWFFYEQKQPESVKKLRKF